MQVLNADHLIACDGAASPVRRHLQRRLEDLEFDEWWMVVDAWLRKPIDLPERCVQYCRPSRPGTYIVGPGSLRRWEIKLMPGERPEDFQTEQSIRKVLGEFVDTEALDLCRSAVYRFHAVVATEWRLGRVFFAGDAAHQMPPFLGQGLGAGVRDAGNLCWKLDAVKRMGAAPALLDTYQAERKPHVRTIVSLAKSFGLIIGELDPVAAHQRDARMSAELESGKAETVRQRFIPGLAAGLIDLDDDGMPRRGAGQLFVQPWVLRERSAAPERLDDVVGPGFLIASTQVDALQWLDDASRSCWSRLQGRMASVGSTADSPLAPDGLQEVEGVFGAFMRENNAIAVVVRPDRYVYGVAADKATLNRLVMDLHRALFSAD